MEHICMHTLTQLTNLHWIKYPPFNNETLAWMLPLIRLFFSISSRPSVSAHNLQRTPLGPTRSLKLSSKNIDP